MAEIVERWRRDPPLMLGGLTVTEVVDLSAGTAELPPTDAVIVRLEKGARVVLRPSGTEPKLKAYFEVVTGPVSPERLAQERRRAADLMGLIESDVAARCQSISGLSANED
jgi:phosphomannomutase